MSSETDCFISSFIVQVFPGRLADVSSSFTSYDVSTKFCARNFLKCDGQK